MQHCSKKGLKQLYLQGFRQYSLYNYSDKHNPRVFFTLSKNGQTLGDLVFELYSNHAPQSAENVLALATGKNDFNANYKGTVLNKGYPGIVLSGGRVTECNASAAGIRLPDENMNLRHFKRGQLTLANDGENANGSEFMITLGKADMLDGYNQLVGELVEGEDVLKQAEECLTRHGTVVFFRVHGDT